MHLLGWINPLPIWIQVAIHDKLITVNYDAKINIEYLEGKAINPQRTIIEFK